MQLPRWIRLLNRDNTANHNDSAGESLALPNWPIMHEREQMDWLAANNRLIGLVRNHPDSYVLPPAVVRKPCWRE